MPRQKEERPAYQPKENRNRKKGKKGERRFGIEKLKEEMPLWKNITCWTTKSESHVGTRLRERETQKKLERKRERSREVDGDLAEVKQP